MEIVFTHAGAHTLDLDADLLAMGTCWNGLEYVERNVTYHRKVLRCIINPYPRFPLAKHNVQNPVHLILNAPVSASRSLGKPNVLVTGDGSESLRNVPTTNM